MTTLVFTRFTNALTRPADIVCIRAVALAIGAASVIADFGLTTVGTRFGTALWWEGNPLIRSLLAAFGPRVFIPMAAAEIAIAAALLWSRRPLVRGAGVGWTIGMLVSHFFLGALTWVIP